MTLCAHCVSISKDAVSIMNSDADNLLVRAANVSLKDRRPLVLLVRETPLHLGRLRLLVQVAEMGAVVMPPMLAFYHRPVTLEEVIDQTVPCLGSLGSRFAWTLAHRFSISSAIEIPLGVVGAPL